MGCLQSTTEDVGYAKNLAIGREIRKDWVKNQQRIRLLLLGTGDSGKSTFMKQVKLLKLRGFPKDERESRRSHISETIIDSMKLLCKEGMESNPDTADGYAKVKACYDALSKTTNLAPSLVKIIQDAWIHPLVRKSWLERSQKVLQLPDSLPYFINELERVAAPKFMPNDQDIVHLRVFTTGVLRESMINDQITLEFVDVGGQRNERKKWLHLFDDSDSLLYFVSLSEYNQFLFEDARVPRMTEALNVFEEIANNEYFKDTHMQVFFNKVDLFREKLCSIPFKIDGPSGRFQDYDGPTPDLKNLTEGSQEFEEYYEAVLKYIQDLFISRRKNKSITKYVTDATDTKEIEGVMEKCIAGLKMPGMSTPVEEP